MNITELKEGQGIIFKTEKEKTRILPILDFLGYGAFGYIPACTASKMTGAPLYVNIEADKKLTYSTAKNFKVVYICSEDINIPIAVSYDYLAAKIGKVAPNLSHVFSFIKADDEQYSQVFGYLFEASKPKVRTGGCTWNTLPKVDYPPHLYDITPQDALTLISFLDPYGKIEFKDKWGDNILEGKSIVVTGLTKQKYLHHCRNKHREEANKLFKAKCPYANNELILVKHFESNDWQPRFFCKMDADGSVLVFSRSSIAPIKYEFHCKAKVIPA